MFRYIDKDTYKVKILSEEIITVNHSDIDTFLNEKFKELNPLEKQYDTDIQDAKEKTSASPDADMQDADTQYDADMRDADTQDGEVKTSASPLASTSINININIICYKKNLLYYLHYIRFIVGTFTEKYTYYIRLYCDRTTFENWQKNCTSIQINNNSKNLPSLRNFIDILETYYDWPNFDLYNNDYFSHEQMNISIIVSDHYLMQTVGYKRGLINYLSRYYFKDAYRPVKKYKFNFIK
jgi:hypothetical protein